RDCHYASTLVHVCDVFDALHTDRPYRPAWPSAKALHYLERRADREFDPTMASTFINLMRKNERAIILVNETTPFLLPELAALVGGGAGSPDAAPDGAPQPAEEAAPADGEASADADAPTLKSA